MKPCGLKYLMYLCESMTPIPKTQLAVVFFHMKHCCPHSLCYLHHSIPWAFCFGMGKSCKLLCYICWKSLIFSCFPCRVIMLAHPRLLGAMLPYLNIWLSWLIIKIILFQCFLSLFRLCWCWPFHRLCLLLWHGNCCLLLRFYLYLCFCPYLYLCLFLCLWP